jgi:hyperosmotically inducible periplasmic protein
MLSLPTRILIVLASGALFAALGGCHRAAGPANLAAADAKHGSAPTVAHLGTLPPTGSASAPSPSAPAASAALPTRPARAAARDDTRAMGAPSTSLASAIALAAPEHDDDATITRQVNAAIAGDKELRRLKIDVDTENGIVTLSGPTPTASAKAHADEVARTVKGVVSVNNQLTLQTG